MRRFQGKAGPPEAIHPKFASSSESYDGPAEAVCGGDATEEIRLSHMLENAVNQVKELFFCRSTLVCLIIWNIC